MNVIRGLAPQPRLLWAIAIGAILIALAVASPVLAFVAIVYHVGLVAVVARDLALLPGRGGYRVRRIMPEPFSLGEVEEVRVVVENPAAAGLTARLADHAPADLQPQPREVAGRFDRAGRLELRTRRRVLAIEGEGSARHVDLLQSFGNALASQFDHFIDLVERSTFSEREAERRSVLPGHELAHRVQSRLAKIRLPSCAS